MTAVLAVTLATGFGVWLLARGGDEPERRRGSAGDAARMVSPGELRELAAAEGPVYWAGPDAGATLELSRRGGAGIFVRHLPDGAEPGDRTGHLTIGTYVLRDAVGAIRRSGRAKGARLFRLDRGGLAVTNRNRPANAYFAYPGQPVQVEVYDPEPGRAAELVRAGRIVPVPVR